MAINVVMPELSATMTEATISRWLKAVGDAVREGEVVVEVESEKATLEVEARASGFLARIVAPDGTDGVKVGEVIAILAEDLAELASLRDPAAGPETSPKAIEAVERIGAAASVAASAAPSEVSISPLARRMATIGGVAIGTLTGTGPRGRIVKADVERALGDPRPEAPYPVTAVARDPLMSDAGTTRVPHTPMRRAIANRLTESKRSTPHFYLNVDCRVDGLLAVRAELNAEAAARGEGMPKLSVNDFVVRAVALALRRFAAVNASWADDAVLRHGTVDIACAVATDKGLLTPILRDADRKGLAAIASELRALARRARAGRLAPEEYQGGGFTISNLGMYGVDEIYPIINPPHAGVLGVGSARAAPVVVDGAVVAGTLMTCTLSADHRVVDGAVGAAFLAAVRAYLERPATMLL